MARGNALLVVLFCFGAPLWADEHEHDSSEEAQQSQKAERTLDAEERLLDRTVEREVDVNVENVGAEATEDYGDGRVVECHSVQRRHHKRGFYGEGGFHKEIRKKIHQKGDAEHLLHWKPWKLKKHWHHHAGKRRGRVKCSVVVDSTQLRGLEMVFVLPRSWHKLEGKAELRQELLEILYAVAAEAVEGYDLVGVEEEGEVADFAHTRLYTRFGEGKKKGDVLSVVLPLVRYGQEEWKTEVYELWERLFAEVQGFLVDHGLDGPQFASTAFNGTVYARSLLSYSNHDLLLTFVHLLKGLDHLSAEESQKIGLIVDELTRRGTVSFAQFAEYVLRGALRSYDRSQPSSRGSSNEHSSDHSESSGDNGEGDVDVGGGGEPSFEGPPQQKHIKEWHRGHERIREDLLRWYDRLLRFSHAEPGDVFFYHFFRDLNPDLRQLYLDELDDFIDSIEDTVDRAFLREEKRVWEEKKEKKVLQSKQKQVPERL